MKGDDEKMFNRRKLQAQMVLRGVKTEDVANELGINASTFYRKMGNDGDFSRLEIQKMIEFLEIENPNDIFFAEADA